jgi:glycosyltransferase involved in cell wall biosynthesis
MHATTAADCGIAEYTRDLTAGLATRVAVELVPITPRIRNPLAMRGLGRRLNRGDVTHIHHNYGFWGRGSLSYRLVFAALQRAIRVPVVLTPHSVFPARQAGRPASARQAVARALGLHAFLDAGTFRAATRIVVHSGRHLDLLAARGIPRARLVRIMPGTPAVIPPAPDTVTGFRARHGLPARGVVAVFGFIQPNKNYELVVEALARLPADVTLLLAGGIRTAGEAWYGDRVRALARARGVLDRVRITGFLSRPEVGLALSAADLCVLPYAADHSVSYSARLCLAYERPLLASPVAAFEELRAQYGCAELFAGDDPATLAEQIGALLAEPERCRRLVEGARAYLRDRSWHRVADEVCRVYAAAIEEGPCASWS